MSKLIYFTGCMLVVGLLVSCKKEKGNDIKGDPDVHFFTSNTNLGNMPDNSITYNVVNVPDAASSDLVNLSTTLPAMVKFPVFASKPVASDVKIGAQLDNSLINVYNTEHNTSYAPFPTGILNTDGLGAMIIKGSTTSSDSITIPADLTKLKALTGTAYMAPIKLMSVSDPNVGKITSNTTIQVTYIVATVEQRKIKYLALATDAQGTLITSRANWVINFTPAPTTVGSITDGSTTTFSRWTASPVQVDINLQATTNVTGIRLYTSNNATYIPTQVEVSVSTDGLNYTVVGAPMKADLTYASSYNYILFYKAIPTKYIRLKNSHPSSTNTQNYRITELDVYAN